MKADGVQQNYTSDFDADMFDRGGEETMGAIGEREIYQGNLLDNMTDDASIFYNDFPPLPDFPCMSKSSSSSSTPALTKPIATSSASSTSSSSSAAASRTIVKSDEQQQAKQHQTALSALSSTASMEGFQLSDCCMDVMESFGYMDLIDGEDIWDPSSVFHTDQQNPGEDNNLYQGEGDSDYMLPGNSKVVQGGENEQRRGVDELGGLFFEWLKTNKEHISAEDMRKIKLKKSTIECASKRLGSNKEGRKQLLKLILEWVEQCQLQRKRRQEEAEAGAAVVSQPCQYQEQFPSHNPDPNFINSIPIDPTTCLTPTWIPPPPPPPTSYVTDPAVVMAIRAPQPPPPQPVFQPLVGYMGDPSVPLVNCHPYPPPSASEYQMIDSAQSWPQSQFSMAYNSFPENGDFAPQKPQPLVLYGDQHPYPIIKGNGEQRLVRMGSFASKEARKKRMARQRRSSVHHYRHHPTQQNQHCNDHISDQHVDAENCASNAETNPSGNWVYWPAVAGAPAVSAVPMLGQPPAEVPPQQQLQPVDQTSSIQPQSYQRQAHSDRRQLVEQQGCKGETNLKFLLQKVLKQSDVGNLGRIVLPKKEAETHLPELEARDGMPIAMEDIGTSKVWNMRYRFWPNNKSRMYLLENTGEFVKANGLQEGDFIVIYSDIKCGKYLIRGVKVRQVGPKAEGRKPARRNHRNSAAATASFSNGNLSSPSKQTVSEVKA